MMSLDDLVKEVHRTNGTNTSLFQELEHLFKELV